MCVNNLPSVALDGGEARIRTRDLLIQRPNHSASELSIVEYGELYQ